MPKVIRPLSAIAVSKITTPGWHAVGGVSGLALQVRVSQGKNKQIQRCWILRTTIGNARVPLGLGAYPLISLAEARDRAKEMLNDVRAGIDPRVKKKELQSQLIAAMAKSKTFMECAEAYMDSHASEYSNEKHRKQWRSTLSTYAYPIIGNMLVSEILKSHAKRTYCSVNGLDSAPAKALAKKLLEGKLVDDFTQRSLLHKGWTNLSRKDTVALAVNALVEHAWLSESLSEKAGRKTTIYKINPRISEEYL